MKKICCQTLIVLCIISLMNINLFANAKSKEFAGDLTINDPEEEPYFIEDEYKFAFTTQDGDEGNFNSKFLKGSNVSDYNNVKWGGAVKPIYPQYDLLIPYQFIGSVSHTHEKTIKEKKYTYSGDWETDQLFDKNAIVSNIDICNNAIDKTVERIIKGEGEIQRCNDVLEILEKSIETIKEQILEYNNKINSEKEKIPEINNKIVEIDKNIKNIQEEIEKLKKENPMPNQKIGELTYQISDLYKEKKRKESEIESIQKFIEDYKDQKVEVSNILKDKENDYERMIDQLKLYEGDLSRKVCIL